MSKSVRRLFQGFKPEHYTLTLKPDADSMVLNGIVVIRGQKVGRPSQRITLHQHGLKIESALVTKKDKKGESATTISRISHHKTFNEVRLHSDALLYPGTYELTLTFSGAVQDSMHGVYVSTYDFESEKKKLVSTQFESHHAREAFPCIDEPEAKATFDLTIISPEDAVALGNTPVKSSTAADGVRTTTFETTPRMSTYLLAFVYGDLQHKKATTKSGVEVGIWATKAQPAAALDFGLDVAVRAIEFYNEYYDTPYPLTKCDHVAIPDFSAGAMENWGLITYRERCLLVDPETASQSSREIVTTVICHELSHQWFGNLVTMRWWDDLWLNESFANVMEYVAADALFPEWHLWNDFVTQEGLAALRRDSIAGVQSVRTRVDHPDQIATLFDPSIVYAKGGRLLNMLKNYIGEADFRKGLKAYFAKHAYSNTTGEDLWQALGAASGKDVSAFMNPWLVQSGYPVIDVHQTDALVSIDQHHFLSDPSKADVTRLWPVPLLATSPALPALFTEASGSYSLAINEYVRLNQASVGHYIVHYTNPVHAQAIADLVRAQKLAVVERLMLLSDNALLARAGQESFASTLALLEHYTDESSEPVWDIMALVTGDARRFIDSDATIEPAIKSLLRGLLQAQFDRLGWEERRDEPSQDTKLRATIIGLGVYAEHEAITAHALELFTQYQQDPQVVPAELRAIVFCSAVRHEVPGAFEYLLGLDETTNNTELKQDIIGSLTAERRPEYIAKLLDRVMNPEKVRKQDVDFWLVSLLRSRFAQQQAWDWMREHWAWLESTFASDMSFDYLPRYAASAFNTTPRLKEYKKFFEPLADRPSLARNIAMGIEEIESRVTWIERDISAVSKYFKDKA